MRVTVPSKARGSARSVGVTVAALALLGAGTLWLALNALVAFVTRD
ncbi:hypothetical protein [Variovorax saccharolyticus]|nr:hypothetical protein [Variovorax sp. J22R187]MDM0016630.1 hypothetical protein [Variovorax sp. J22R187]